MSKKKNNIEYKLKNDDILYFLQIPKTGGTNLRTILENNFEFDNILYEYVWEDLLKKIPTDFSKYKLIIGHFGYRLYRILPKQPVYMSMLRDLGINAIGVDPYGQFEESEFLKKTSIEKLCDIYPRGYFGAIISIEVFEHLM